MLLLVVICSALYAAEKAPADANAPSRAVRRWGVGASLGGPGWLYTVSGDYYIIPNINIEVGGSLLPRVPTASTNFIFTHIGLKYAILGHQAGQRWSPYIGTTAAMIIVNGEITFYQANSSIFSVNTSTERVFVPFLWLYFPVGVELVAYNGFTFSVEAGFVYAPTQSRTLNSDKLAGASNTVELSNTANAWGAIRFGYHF